jgi:DNA polymerase III epsilon subunit-like protein
MINNNYIIVADTETSGLDWTTDELVQLSCLTIDPYKLEIIPNSIFDSLVKPINLLSGTEEEIQAKWQKSWKAFDVNKKTREELEKAPLPEHIFKAFSNHVKKYHTGGWNGKPILAGHNIQGFDLYWIEEYAKRYKLADKQGKQQLFNSRTILDTLNICFLWFENLPEPEALSLDVLRKYFGINTEGSHNSLKDIQDTAEILIKFLKLHRRFASKVTFKDSFRN